jgi:hypothetical protein
MAAEAARPGGPARAIARALAFVSLLACGSAQAFDLAELMGLMAHRPSGQARFTEQRYVKGFDAPLVASGTLEYQPPDRFTRRTLDPRAETMSVEGNTLTLTRAGRTRTLALDAAPEAVVAIEALRGTLTGNAATLQRWFRVSLSGDAAHWALELAPLDTRAAGPLAGVRIEGRGDAPDTIETRLANGDHTVMAITPMAPGAAAAPASAP